MKDEIYCFVKFTTAKYEINCIVTDQNDTMKFVVTNQKVKINVFQLIQNLL